MLVGWKQMIGSRTKRYMLFIMVVLLGLFVGLGIQLQHVRREEQDTQCYGNLYRLRTALLGYWDNLGCLPPPIITDPSGKPLYSWRVLILTSFADVDFDYTKSWDDPHNLQLSKQANPYFVNSTLPCVTCPAINHKERGHTDYFYVLSIGHRWPRDFFPKGDPPRKILLAESQSRGVYWSEPVDLVYRSGQQFLQELRQSQAPHRDWFNCIATERPIRIPVQSTPEHDSAILAYFENQPIEKESWESEQIDKFVTKSMGVLGDPANDWRGRALLMLGELGPRAKKAVPMIRRVLADNEPKLSRVAAMVLERIEK